MADDISGRIESRGLVQHYKTSGNHSPKDLVSRLREQRKSSLVDSRQPREYDSREEVLYDLREIAQKNKHIESAVKKELLAIDGSLLQRASYRIGQMFQSNNKQSAEDLITEQTGRVSQVVHGIEYLADTIQTQSRKLQKDYESLDARLHEGINYRESATSQIREDLKLLEDINSQMGKEENTIKQVEYRSAHRTLKLDVQEKMLELKRKDRELLRIEKEMLPRMDKSREIVMHYASELKETCDEARDMLTTIHSLQGIYLAVMRSGRMSAELMPQISKLFTYTSRMNDRFQQVPARIEELRAHRSLLDESIGTPSMLEQISAETFELFSEDIKRLDAQVNRALLRRRNEEEKHGR